MGVGRVDGMNALLFVLLTAAPTTVPVKAEFHYTLANPGQMTCLGKGCPEKLDLTQRKKTWFFVVPAKRADHASMNELLHRIFYDSNEAMHAREPGDPGYMKLLDVKVSKVDEKSMLSATSPEELPWRKAADDALWEPSCCYLVDDAGHWDTLKWGELTELFAMRLMDRKALSDADFLAFWKRLAHNDSGQTILNDKANRQKNLTVVRVDPARRKPGSKPIVSAPAEAAAR